MNFKPVEFVKPPQKEQKTEVPNSVVLTHQIKELVKNPLPAHCSTEDRDIFLKQCTEIFKREIVDYSVDPIPEKINV